MQKGSFVCALCNNKFTRRSTVFDPHFSRCVRKNGNPKRLVWDGHSSCWRKLPGDRFGPSGVVPPGLPPPSDDDEDEDEDDYEDEQEDEEGVGHDGGEPTRQVGPLPTEPQVPSDPLYISWTPTDGSPAPPISPASPQRMPLPRVEPRPGLSLLHQNQIANIVFTASRTAAGLSDESAASTFNLWYNLLPEGVFSHIQAPVPGQSQRLRQQAVVWLAQDVYVARLRRARGLEEQLKMVELWRDIMFTLGDTEGVGKLHDMLHQVLGSRWRNLGSF